MATRLTYWLSVGSLASALVLMPKVNEKALAQCDYMATVLADNPVTYWRLGDTSADFARDEVGPGPYSPAGGHPGAYIGAVQLGQSGALGGDTNGCIFLDGSGATMEVPDAPALNFVSAPFSIEAWVKKAAPFGPCQLGCIRRIVDKVQGGFPNGYGLDMNDNVIRTTGSTNFGVDFVTSVGTWYHLVAVSNGQGQMTIFANGVLKGSGAYQSANPWNGALLLGIDSTGGSQFVGWIDEVAVYDYALSAQQVTAHFVAATTGLHIANHPFPASVCPSNGTSFNILATGVGGLAYRWQLESAPLGSNLWTDLFDGPIPGGSGVASTTSTETLTISGSQVADPVRFRCRVTNACGSVYSEPATFTVVTIGDLNCDCAINGLDIAKFVQALLNPTGFTGCNILHGDINGDLAVDQLDISGFTSCSMAGICP